MDCASALSARLAVPKARYGLERLRPLTAVLRYAPLIRHRRRSQSHPKQAQTRCATPRFLIARILYIKEEEMSIGFVVLFMLQKFY